MKESVSDPAYGRLEAETYRQALIFAPELRRAGVPYHIQHLRKLVRRGEFPTPVPLGRRRAWVRGEVLDWVRRQAENRHPA